MKIAFIVTQFPVISETFILRQITGLLERGHDVDIFAYSGMTHSTAHADIDKYGLLKRTHYLTPAHAPRAGWAVSQNGLDCSSHIFISTPELY